jgi:type III restriction enzyme
MKHVDLSALDPLFEPWEIPHLHREKADAEGMPAKIVRGRRPSPVPMVQALRREVSEWRDAGYPGASDTTQTLFAHWFGRSHSMETDKGLPFEFRYYFCQREAIETFVYLMEIRGITRLSRMYDEFGGADRETLVLGVTEEEDRLARYALKVATGAGKTKIMSLVIAWSYFHAVRESYSPMPRAFLVIAPNLTVYERLKDDFGDGRIFETDPILPAEWRGDWNLSVVLQDAAGGGNASAGGAVLYLTNIHRLYDPDKRVRAADTYGFMGPAVSRSKALNTGETLRARIASHGSLLVLNDEAHHVWDPDSAWNEAIASIHDECRSLGGQGVLAQLDLSATPKDNQGNFFKHIICDTPLGEAVDAGIVKTPVIGSSTTPLKENPSEDAAVKYEQHLLLGYECWKRSADEWKKSGRKPLLFVMCEDTEAADAITRRLDSDERFKLLNGRTINLHTNLKGKLKKVGSGASATYQFIENESDISNEDLRRLREISRQLDSDSSPWLCIVSVLMLREGWDVRNVTTIVPLRAFSSKARILPEQTLGRGLRRMTVPGKAGAHEIITVVEHPAFAHLYDQELAQEGLFVDVIDAEQIPKNTVSIYPDPRKDQERLDIPIPTLDPGFSRTALLPPIPWKDIEVAFSELALSALPLAGATERVIEYEGKALITGELIERFKIDLGLAATPLGAISFYRKQIEDICKIQNTHRILGPLLERFITEILFGARLDLFDPRLAARLGDGDVQEYIRAVFVPLVRTKITVQQKRKIILPPRWISTWSPYQATSNERHPCLKASATLFNLVPCTLALETAFVKFADGARDVAAFYQECRPECLRIDYIALRGHWRIISRISSYVPRTALVSSSRRKDG